MRAQLFKRKRKVLWRLELLLKRASEVEARHKDRVEAEAEQQTGFWNQV